MRKLLFFLLTLLSFWLNAQTQLQNFDKTSALVENYSTTDELYLALDSIQPNYDIELYAQFKSTSLTTKNATLHNPSNRLTWRFSLPNLKTRVYFSKVTLNQKDTLFFYTSTGNLVEQLTQANIIGDKLTSPPSNGGLVIQLANHSQSSIIQISGYSIEPSSSEKRKGEGFRDSEACQVNVNCSEGDTYKDVQRSVVRILVKLGSQFAWCTGSILNNTRYDYQPYLLTAEHCGLIGRQLVPQSELDFWTFYFNYEGDDCENPNSDINLDDQRITGGTLLANSDDNGGDSGSDFLLLKLSESIPSSFNTYYAGWNHQVMDIPSRGACIHHPNGDIKKVSTYINPATSSSFTTQVSDSHWSIKWIKTANGHGTTEGGSSGSPLYDENLLLRGALTGGASSCSNTDGPDLFGKLSFSWNNNGSKNNRRLDVWLDPDDLGFLALNGANQGDTPPFLSNDINIFPVPAFNGELFVRNIGLPQDNLSLNIYDSFGKKVYTDKLVAIPGQDISIDISNFRDGMYILLLERNGKLIEKKMVVHQL